MHFAFDILSLGYAARELLCWVDRFPAGYDSIVANRTIWTFGGMASNLAYSAGKVGAKVAMVCAIGDDPAGRDVISALRSVGVDTEYVIQQPGMATPTVILTINSDGVRAGLVINHATHNTLRIEDVPESFLAQSRVFFTDLSPSTIALEAARKAKESGTNVAFDMQMAEERLTHKNYTQLVNQMFEVTDFYFADESNFLLWRRDVVLEDALDAVLQERPETTCIITQGEAGSIIATANERISVPAFPIDGIVDSIGAGDAYHGVFLYTHLSLGWSLYDAGVCAAATAALSCRAAGARDGCPTMAEVRQFLNDRHVSLPTS